MSLRTPHSAQFFLQVGDVLRIANEFLDTSVETEMVKYFIMLR